MATSRRGLCSTYLSRCQPGDFVPGWISRPSPGLPFTACLPSTSSPWSNSSPGLALPQVPLLLPSCLMVGTGTGVAPFRSFLKLQACLLGQWTDKPMRPAVDAAPVGQSTGEEAGSFAIAETRATRILGSPVPRARNLLFFGCRDPDRDFYFANDWSDLESKGILRLCTAFSRIQTDAMYVQQRIRQQGHLVADLLLSTAVFTSASPDGANADQPMHHYSPPFVFVAGNAKEMPTAVREAIVEVLIVNGALSQEQAEEFVRQMEVSGRYRVEAWA
ncbi:unnamed protein product [Protopolystoma xenopodis]|uniref:Oxidoreductase FAD/NAD(P)-binding domain-containing protein n=1 Tax=Protopolystoma xenopodis TaxID=117903 RepID=A0A448WF41_9PLAT|nr:unnamed protein product [Protopolystoma xenopodis]